MIEITAADDIPRLYAFTIDGVTWCNPITLADTGHLAHFAARRDIKAGDVLTAEDYWPVLRAEGLYQNVAQAPQIGAKARACGWPGDTCRPEGGAVGD